MRSICSRYLLDLSYQCWLYLVPATVENWFASSIFRTIWFELTIYWSIFRTPRRGTPNLPTHSGFLHQNQSSCNSSTLVKTLFSVIPKLSTPMWSLAHQSQDLIIFPYVAIYIIYTELIKIILILYFKLCSLKHCLWVISSLLKNIWKSVVGVASPGQGELMRWHSTVLAARRKYLCPMWIYIIPSQKYEENMWMKSKKRCQPFRY